MIIRRSNTHPIKYYNKNNRKCPKCKKPMVWVEGLIWEGIDITVGKYSCEPCKTFHKVEESRAVKRGRKLAKNINLSTFKQEDILHFSSAVQIGILRELQHGKNGYLNK